MLLELCICEPHRGVVMKYKVLLVLVACGVVIAEGSTLFAQTSDTAQPAGRPQQSGASELDAIRHAALSFAETFNRGDAKAIAELWTTDGEYVDDTGRTYDGREAIEKGYADFFAANPKAKLRLVVESVRLLGDAAALEYGQAILEPSSGGVSTSSQYSVVHIKVEGRWLMASVRDTHVDSGSTYEYIADLEWLIGAWTAEEHGVKTESVCRWIGDKSFVERKYTTTGTDGAESTGVQIIGWNAREGHVQSWNFSPDGAFAVGVWAPIEDGWQASVDGVTVDGTATAAVTRLQRLDDNAYVWQSVGRSLGDTPLPDSDEIVMRRNSQK